MRRSEALGAAAIYALVVCCFFWPVIFLGKVISANDFIFFFPPWSAYRPAELRHPSNGQLGDQISQFYPFQHYLKESLRRGDLPLWNPYIRGGAPFLANAQSAVFYPLNLLLYPLPLELTFTVSAMLRLAIAGLGMYLYMRSLGAAPIPAHISGLAFMFCGFNIVWLNHPHTNVSIFLPLLLLLCDKLLDRRRARQTYLLALVLGLQLLGGHVETSFHICVFAVSYFLWRAVSEHRLAASCPSFLLACALGAMLAAVMILPFVELLSESSTWEERSSSVGLSFPPSVLRYLILLFVPNFLGNPADNNWWGVVSYNELSCYVGIAPLILSFLALARRPRDRRVVFLGVAAALSILIAYRQRPIFDLVNALPLFRQAQNHRLLLIAQFALAALAGLGTQSLIEPSESGAPKRQRVALALALLLSISVASVPFLFPGIYEIPEDAALRGYILRNVGWFLAFAAASLALLAFATGKLARLNLALLLLLTFLDLYRFGSRYNPLVEPNLAPGRTPESVRFLQTRAGFFRFAALGDHLLLPNVPMLYGISDVRGYDLPTLDRYHMFMRELVRSKDTLLPVYYIPQIDERNLSFLSLFGVKYIVSQGGDLARDALAGKLKPVYQGEVTIYENAEAFPRAFIVHRIEVEKPSSMLSKLASLDLENLKSMALMESLPEEAQTLRSDFKPQGQMPEIISYKPDKVDVEAKVSSPGLLVLTDTFYPGWKASVDGSPKEVYRVDYLFRGVFIGEGKHRVSFVYDPLSFKLGAGLSLISLALIVTGLVGRNEPAKGAGG